MSRVKDWQIVAEVANHGSNSPLYDRFDSAFKNLSSKENPSLVERQSLKRAGHSLYTKDLSGGSKDTGKGVEQIASIAKDKKEYPVTAYDDPTSMDLTQRVIEYDEHAEDDKTFREQEKAMERALIEATSRNVFRGLDTKMEYENKILQELSDFDKANAPEYWDHFGSQALGNMQTPAPKRTLSEGSPDIDIKNAPDYWGHFGNQAMDIAPIPHAYSDKAPEYIDRIHRMKQLATGPKQDPQLYASTNPNIQIQDQVEIDRADQQRQASDYYHQEQPMSFNRSGLLSSDDANRATYEMEHFAPGVGGYSLWNRDSNGNLYRDPNGGNCTSWAYARAIALGADPNNLVTGANARDWISRAQNMGVEVGSTPAVGATVAWPADNGYWGKLGHVGIVENVHPDGSFDMSHSGATIVARRGVRAAVDTIHYDPGTQSFYVEDGRGNHRLLNTSFIYFS